MSSPSDTFAAFVDRLADALRDGESGRVDGDALAARVGLSPFHLDRIVRSVAEENPGAFRRRILLERAGFRLLATHTPLLDIATAAEYSSPEAFIRAFARAFGGPPAEWRRVAGTFRLPASNGVHFHPPGSIRLPGRDKVTEMDLLERMVAHHIWLTGEMIRVAGDLDDAQLNRLIVIDVDDDEQTVRSLLARLVGQLAMWNAVMAGRGYDLSTERHQSLGDLRDVLAVEGPAFLAHVREVVDGQRLDETIVDASGESVEVISYGGNLAHVLTFAAHRRTLVLLALDAAGRGELGWGDPRHWVADH